MAARLLRSLEWGLWKRWGRLQSWSGDFLIDGKPRALGNRGRNANRKKAVIGNECMSRWEGVLTYMMQVLGPRNFELISFDHKV